MAHFPSSGGLLRGEPSDRATLGSDHLRLSGIRLKAAYVRKATAVAHARLQERRDSETRKALVQRVRSEFHEMPGLNLTLVQAVRLFGIPRDMCTRVLDQLVDSGWLRLTQDGRFALRAEVS